MTDEKHLIVIGGGIAGISAAQAARHEYPHARITVYGEETTPFYNKIALGSVITGKMRPEQLRLFTPDWLENQRIRAHWSAPVESVDVESHLVHFAHGDAVRYDKLILATGARPVVPSIQGIETGSALPLWSLADAVRIRDRLEQVETVAIIGGGVLGVEMAVDLRAIGKQITLIESQRSVLPLHLSPPAARAYALFLQSAGIHLELGVQITHIDSQDRTHTLVAQGGRRHRADLVLLMAGVRPNMALARAAGLDTDRGILVDAQMQTSDPDVLACGNCTQIGEDLSALWNAARSQGTTAGQNAFEYKKPWPGSAASIHLKTPRMPLFVCGRYGEVLSGEKVIEVHRGETYHAIHFDNQRRIKYAIMIHETAGAHLIERAYRQQKSISEEAVGQQSIDAVMDELQPAQNGTAGQMSGWTCQMCGYVHEGDDPPELCPVCSVGKDQFMAA